MNEMIWERILLGLYFVFLFVEKTQLTLTIFVFDFRLNQSLSWPFREVVATALYDFNPREVNQLPLRQGCQVLVIGKEGDSKGWWRGKTMERVSKWITCQIGINSKLMIYSHISNTLQVGFFPKEYVREYPQPSEELWCYNYMVFFPTGKSHSNDTNNNSNKSSPSASVTPRNGSVSSSSSNRSISSIAHGSQNNDKENWEMKPVQNSKCAVFAKISHTSA